MADGDDRPLGMGHRGVLGGYAEGERVFAPPQGTFDVDWVTGLAVREHPALVPAEIRAVVQAGWDALCGGVAADGFALGAALARDRPDLPVALVAELATLVVEAAVAYDALP